MKWYRKPDTKDYECIFFDKNGTEIKYELPFRKLEIEVVEIAARENLNRGYIFHDGTFPLSSRLFLSGKASLSNGDFVTIIGRDDFRASDIVFQFLPLEDNDEYQNWSKAVLKQQDDKFANACDAVGAKLRQREKGVPDSTLVFLDGNSNLGTSNHLQLDMSLPSDALGRIHRRVVDGKIKSIQIYLQFWDIFCENDYEFQRERFNFMLCPSEEDGIARPMPARGYISTMLLDYREIELDRP